MLSNILVYKLEFITERKIFASFNRVRIRDLYDLCFIIKNYYDQLSELVKFSLSKAFFYKRIEYAEYLIKTQKDPLINSKRLSNDFNDAYQLLAGDFR